MQVLRIMIVLVITWVGPCWTVSGGEAWDRWHNTLAPHGEPGQELTLSQAGTTDYAIVVPEVYTSQERKAAEELALWLGRMTGAQFVLPPFPVLQNSDFEISGPWKSGGFPFGWAPPPEGYESPAIAQTGKHAIGGSGISAYMPVGGRTGMRQSGLRSGSVNWTFDMDFASEDPPPEGDASSLYMTIGLTGGGAITFFLKDESDNGRGELYFRDRGNDSNQWRVFDDVILFDDNVRETPRVHHLRIVADFDRTDPSYDVYLTDPNGKMHHASGVKKFNKLVRQGEMIDSITSYTAWNVAAHLLDNVRVTTPEKQQAGLAKRLSSPDRFISIGRTRQLADANLPQAKEDLGEEGYAIVQQGNNLFLLGGSRRGPINAVLSLLEEDLGCRWYTSGISATFANINRIPSRPTLKFRPVTRVYVPQFQVRDPHYCEAWEGHWALRNRTSGQYSAIAEHWGGQRDYAIRTHSFDTLVPKSTYFATHPEYFMLNLDGMRVDLQLCPSNSNILPIAASVMRQTLASRPDAEYIALSANDGIWRCHCTPCRTLDKAADPGKFCHHCFLTHYSSAGSLLHMANRLGEMIKADYPDVKIMAQSYLSSQRAPINAKIRDNVSIELCNHDQLLNRPIDWTTSDFSSAHDYREQLQRWLKLTENLYIWEYTSNYPHIMMVTPNMGQIGAATRWYADGGVQGLMFQGNHGATKCAERALMRVWVMAKLLWDPSRDIDALQQDFIWGFYGQAAPAVSQYYTLLDDLGQGKFNPLNVPFTGVPGLENGVGPWVKPFVIQASTIFDRAERLAENQQIRARVLLERASLIYLQLENGPEFANDLNEDYGALIDQFEQIVQPQQTSQLGYRDTLQDKLGQWRKRWQTYREEKDAP